MTTATLRDQLTAAEADLHEISEKSRAAYRRWQELDQQQTRKAAEAKELRRQIREEDAR
jgi:hypothetical protein